MRGNTIELQLEKDKVAIAGSLYQYDYGQRLILSGAELPVSYEVHFSNDTFGNSKTSIGDATGVDIPDEYLLNGNDIHVWLFLHEGESDGETEYHGIIHVVKRAQPTDQAPTPVQQSAIDQAIAALNAAVAQCDADVAMFDTKADKTDTVLLTTLSMGRKEDTTVGDNSVALGTNVEASGNCSFAQGYETIASGVDAHAEGGSTTASGNCSHAEGNITQATGHMAHAEGSNTTASGNCAHAEGASTTASNNYAHAEGYGTTASGANSHAEGTGTTASGSCSHAEGVGTRASMSNAHAEGASTVASGYQSHAEGASTAASGNQSHAEGASTSAFGNQSHAEGTTAKATGYSSHVEGNNTVAVGAYEHVSGQYNVIDTAPAWVANTFHAVGELVSREESYVDASGITRSYTTIYKCKTANSDATFNVNKWTLWGQYLEVIGNGTSSNDLSNARTLDWDGNERLKGDLYINCNADSSGGIKVAFPAPPTSDGAYKLTCVVSDGNPSYSWVIDS